MDIHVKQWRNQQQKAGQPPAKLPRLLDPHHHQHHQQQPSRPTAPYTVHHPLQHYPHYHPALLQQPAGRGDGTHFALCGPPPPSIALLDQLNQRYTYPQPTGRCRRTDGKTWRCSKDVVVGHHYCQFHKNGGRNRSRNPVEVEIPTPTTDSGGGGLEANSPIAAADQPLTAVAGGTHFAVYGPPPPPPSIDQLNQRCRRTEGKGWRCSKDAVAGHRHCQRHINRDRNRSTKPVEVEIPTPTTTTAGGGEGLKANTPIAAADQPLTAVAGGTHFAVYGPPPPPSIDQLNQRCRRTDGKRWRCSKDVVAGHRHCQRHINRDRNRSTKPVEVKIPTPTTTTAGGGGGEGLKANTPIAAAQPLTPMASGTHFALPPPSIAFLQPNQRCRFCQCHQPALLPPPSSQSFRPTLPPSSSLSYMPTLPPLSSLSDWPILPPSLSQSYRPTPPSSLSYMPSLPPLYL